MAETRPPLLLEVEVGDLIAGKYLVDRVLGVGGMGVVVAARHLQLETPVAIKMLLPSLLGVRELVLRFEREARAAARVTNEHVARVFDVGTLPSGSPYMVMELLDGCDLGVLLNKRGPLPFELAVEFVRQACAALDEAHALGIIHRDIKPSNLFCIRRPDSQPFIKVLDFGISKLSGGAGAAATQTAMLLGTPLYMSPEQMRSSKDVNTQTDIWSLGVVLHELLTGTPPFSGDTLPEICVRIATEAPSPLRSVRPDVPARLEAVVSKCIARDLAVRYASARDLSAALAEFAPASRTRLSAPSDAPGQVARGESVRSESRTKVRGDPKLRETTSRFGLSQGSVEPPGRRLIVALGAGAIALVAVGLLVFLVLEGSAGRNVAPDGMGAFASSVSVVSAGSVAPLASLAPAMPSTVTVRAAPTGVDGSAGVSHAPGLLLPSDDPSSTPTLSRPAVVGAHRRTGAAGTAGAVGAASSPTPGASAPRRPAAPPKADDAYEHM